MPSIIGEKYRYAADSKSGWTISDKIFEYLEKAGQIYNEIRYPQPGEPEYVEMDAKLRQQEMGMFGLPKPWGGVMLIGGSALLVWAIYKIAK